MGEINESKQQKEKIEFLGDTEQVAIERFNIDSLERLGGGSDRDVFLINDDYVIKIAKTARGLSQNDAEGDWGVEKFVPRVVERGLDYVVVDKVDRNDSKSREFLKPFKKFSPIDFDNKTSDLQDAFHSADEKHDGFSDFMNYDLLWNDFTSGRNWGWKGETPVLIDAGTLQKSILKVTDYTRTDWQMILSKKRVVRNRLKKEIKKDGN